MSHAPASNLADFVIDYTSPIPQIKSGSSDFEPRLNNPEWVLFVDGARNEKGSGARILIRSPDNMVMEYALRFTFSTTNNKVEYEAMVAGMDIVKSLGITRIWVKGDSKLIIDQVKGFEQIVFEPSIVKHEPLVKYHERAIQLDKGFE
ncbi:hypothetical protein LIER_06182 [Lithospermum erythrorhizon]|uniref:RNase H type-1 domain-containing protein n=1 Tax=Lithospermum erythrorhizon TaxID=34254 RepID=A0AAV3P4W8_LITER